MNDNGKTLLKKYRPVMAKADWLPAGLWPELDEIRDQHEEAVANLAEAKSRENALRFRLEREDKARVDAYKTGAEAPEMTPPAEREAQTRDAKARVEGADARLAETVEQAVALIEANAAEWLADLARRERDAEEGREEAARLLAEADRASAEVARIDRWLRRTTGDAPLGHISHKNLPLPNPDRHVREAEAARIEALTEASVG